MSCPTTYMRLNTVANSAAQNPIALVEEVIGRSVLPSPGEDGGSRRMRFAEYRASFALAGLE